VFKPDGGREDDDPVCDQCHEVAEVFLIHHRVHHKDEKREEEVVDELKPEEDPQVEPDLEMEIPHARLNEHASRRQECHPHDEHKTESQELAHEEDRFRHRSRVGNLAQARVPFPPDQLAGVEHDEQRDQHPGKPWTVSNGRGQRCDDLRCSREKRNSAEIHEQGHQQDHEYRDGCP
jgi:hypothetical protein